MSRKQYIWLLLVAMVACVGTTFAQQDESSASTSAEETEVDIYANAPVLDSDAPKQYRIREVRVHGALANADLIPISVGISKGDSIYLPGSFTSATLEALWAQRRFSDIKLGAEIEGSDVDLDLYVVESPRVLNWDFKGLTRSQQTSLTDELKLKRNSEYSDFAIETNKTQIKKYFAEKGFRNVEVEALVENNKYRKHMVDVTFEIDRKEKVKIGEITFEGNEVFEDKRLRRALKKTKEKNLINTFKSAKFNESDYKNDLVELIDFYNSKGYRNATVLGDSIYDINEKRIGVNIKVSEGNKYYIRNISWVGNSKYETEHLQRMFTIEPGDVYDKSTIYKRLGLGKDANPNDMSILTLYQNGGYLMSQIDPAELIIGADSIDLEIKIFEGNPFTINNVTITGNERLDDEVIRRELYTRPGELYNRSLLMQTMQTLGAMGHFNSETMMPAINPISNSLVDIGWPLEEQPSDQFNVSGGWGSGTFVASVGIVLNNLSVKRMFNGGKWNPYPSGQNQKLSLSLQTNGTYYKSASMTFTDPWLGGKKPNSLSVSVFYSDQNNAYYAWEDSSQYFRTLGLSAGIGKRLSWPDPYFTLYGELSYQRYMLEDWSSFIMTDGDANMISLKGVLSRSTVDNPTFPRSGTNFEASLQFTPPFSLWDGKDYSYDDDGESNIDDEERYKFIEFHKWTLKTEWYQSLFKNSKLVLKLSAEMGYVGYYNEDKLSPFERFQVGGDGMSGYSSYGLDLIALRGYEDGALDPINTPYSLGDNKYTM
ncbi:MAG: POTRA domain-containing protein, partial [Rikenellaceae bacterium]